MKRMTLTLGLTVALGIAIGVIGPQALNAQEQQNLKETRVSGVWEIDPLDNVSMDDTLKIKALYAGEKGKETRISGIWEIDPLED